MKKVLYISYDGMTDPLGQSQVLPYLAGLRKKGHQIHLISFEKKDRYEELRDDILKYCNDNDINWYPEWYTSKPPIISTIKDIRTANKRVSELMNQYSFDIIHCRSYIAALVGQKWKRERNVKFVFDMRGFWADERVDGGIWKLSNPLFKQVYLYFKRKEKGFLENADAIVSLTNRAKQEMESWDLAVNLKGKIHVIPCCADLNLFKTNRSQFNANEPFILGYVGSIGTWYMLDEMLDFFKVLKKNYPSAEFHFATKDDAKGIVQKAISKGIDEKDIKVKSFKHSEVPGFIDSLDASVLFILPTYSKMASCPTKLGELMAMGVPSFANAGVGDTEQIIIDYKAGAVVNGLNENAYQKAIDELKFADFSQTLQGAKDVFSLEEGVERYHHIYQNI